MIGFFTRDYSRTFTYPRFNLLTSPLSRISFVYKFDVLLRIASVLIFLLIILTGLFGNQRPVDNLAPTFVWVIWWVGFAFFVSLIGNIWAFLNPWKIVFTWWEALYESFSDTDKYKAPFRYPAKLGMWPGVALFLVFAWMESAFVDSVVPRILANFVIVYSLVTWSGMLLFGKHEWLRYGEVFSIVFGLMSKFSMTEVRVLDLEVCRDLCPDDCRIENGDCVDCYECFDRSQNREFNLRPPIVGITSASSISPSGFAMVMLLLAMVSFDGFSATPEWVSIQTFFILKFPTLTYQFFNGGLIANSIGLVITPVFFGGVFVLFLKLICYLVGAKRSNVSILIGAFSFSLLPIAIVYNYAHFTSLLIVQGQQLILLISDPFGIGWDLFGTATYQIDFGIINPLYLWLFVISLIVIGHIASVYLAHLKALQLYRKSDIALKSQIPMLVLMVLYTMVSLWIVSRPIIE